MNLTPRLNRLEPNIVIDGAMEIWPEGTSRSIANNTDAYGAVLIKNHNGSTGVTLTASQQTSVPSGTELSFSSQISKTAAGSLAAGTYCFKAYNVEGYDAIRMYKQETSLIFWVKSSIASNRSIAVQNTGFTHSYVQQYNIAQANTWELKVVKLPALNTCPGSINRTSGLGARIVFSIVHGSTYQTASLSQWVSGLLSAGIGEDTTWLTGTNHDFSIAGVMLLPGDWTSLTSAEYQFIRSGKNFQQEFQATQRYYENAGTPGTNVGISRNVAVGSTTVVGFSYKVNKRVAASVVIEYDVSDGGTTTVGAGNNTVDGFNVQVNIGSGSFGSFLDIHSWTADARF